MKGQDLRHTMPQTASWVEQRRREWGAAHVNACIRRALAKRNEVGEVVQAGEPGLFYALEGGQVLGTPFPATHPIAEMQHAAVVLGCTFAAFMAEPGQQAGQGS